MSKTILSTLVVTLFCVAGSAFADQGIATSTLSEMGLSGLVVMSDSQAMAIRGMGYRGHDGYKSKKANGASASGKSWAKVDLDGRHEEAEAGSRNEYKAKGKYEASGENFSEATLAVSDILRVDYSDGTHSIETTTHSIHVEAGGFSSAKAF